MGYIALSAVIGLLLFLCAFLGFKEGLRLGIKASKGQEIPKTNLVKPFINLAEAAKNAGADNKILNGFNAMMSYDGTPPKKEE